MKKKQPDAEINLAFCDRKNIPIINRELADGSFAHNENQLFLSFLFPQIKCSQLGLEGSFKEKEEKLTHSIILAFNKLGVSVQFQGNRFMVDGNEIGTAVLGQVNEAFSFFCSMNLDKMTLPVDSIFSNTKNDYSHVSVKEVTGKLPSLEGSAEALLSSFEEIFSLALIPSMPMPEEMDAIYEWDNKLMSNENQSQIKQKKFSSSYN